MNPRVEATFAIHVPIAAAVTAISQIEGIDAAVSQIEGIDAAVSYLFGVPFSVVLAAIGGGGFGVYLHPTISSLWRIAAAFALNSSLGIFGAQLLVGATSIASHAPQATAFLLALCAQIILGVALSDGPKTLSALLQAFVDAARKALGLSPSSSTTEDQEQSK